MLVSTASKLGIPDYAEKAHIKQCIKDIKPEPHWYLTPPDEHLCSLEI